MKRIMRRRCRRAIGSLRHRYYGMLAVVKRRTKHQEQALP